MGNRLYGYERYAQRLFDWNSDRFPVGSWLEFERQGDDLSISLHSFHHNMAETIIEDVDKHDRKAIKSAIKFTLRRMARYCDSVADWN